MELTFHLIQYLKNTMITAMITADFVNKLKCNELSWGSRDGTVVPPTNVARVRFPDSASCVG